MSERAAIVNALRTRTGARPGCTGLVVALTACALTGLPAGAHAARLVGTDGMIHACLVTRTGQIRVIDPRRSCPRGQTALAWSQRGLSGPAGPDQISSAAPLGPPGPRGPAGRQGSQGTTGTTTSYTAGRGLALTGTTLATDPTQVQNRLRSNCPANLYMSGIRQDGTPNCDFPAGDITDIANSGGLLTLNGTNVNATARGPITLGLDPGTVQRRIGSCGPQGQVVTSVGQDGAPTCNYKNSDSVVFHDESQGVSSTGYSDVITLSQVVSGQYLIRAKLDGQGSSGTIQCQLSAGTDTDTAQLTGHSSLTLLVAHNFTSPATPSLRCERFGGDSYTSVRNIKVALSRVGSVVVTSDG